jgi:hypothetical protein
VTPQESGELCLMSCLLGENRDIFFPKLSENLHLTKFSDIAVRFLEHKGYDPVLCKTEEEARELVKILPQKKQWPCLFTVSDTTGEKDFEEFFTDKETLDLDRFHQLGVIKNGLPEAGEKLVYFENYISALKEKGQWQKEELVELFNELIPHFGHLETGKYLDSKM